MSRLRVELADIDAKIAREQLRVAVYEEKLAEKCEVVKDSIMSFTEGKERINLLEHLKQLVERSGTKDELALCVENIENAIGGSDELRKLRIHSLIGISAFVADI